MNRIAIRFSSCIPRTLHPAAWDAVKPALKVLTNALQPVFLVVCRLQESGVR
ncbi:MAG TPA: hypothetical protein PK196_08110 [Methanoculleus sp.]|nr:hypothetical protein [Methanoculleus sp.]HRD26431.1 hypothetical protein [Methanoculleus sp.]